MKINKHLIFPFRRSERIWDQISKYVVFFSIGSYLLFYVLIPDVYAIGPTLLFIMALFGIWREKLLFHVDHESRWLISVLLLYFVGLAVPLLLHGEDISEFDLSTRYIAAALVLLVVLRFTISASWFFSLVAIGALIDGIFALYRVEISNVSRVTAFDNPIHYGNGAMAMALIAISAIGWARRQRCQFFWVTLLCGGFVGGMYASLMSGTRSGWVAVPVIVLIGLYVYRAVLLRNKSLLLVSLVIVVAGLSVVSQIDLVERRSEVAVEQFVDYYAEGLNNTSVGLRLDMWKAGWAAFQTNFLIGAGPTGTDAVIDKLVLSKEIYPSVQDFRHLHNQYIDNMARYGLVGLVCYFLLLAVPFILFLRKTRSEIISVQALALGGCFFIGLHAVVNLTQSILERNIGVMMFVFMIVFIWSTIRGEEMRSIDKIKLVSMAGSDDVSMD